jgi:hypothetical protein
MPIGPPVNPSCFIDPKHRVCGWMPGLGQRLNLGTFSKDKECRYCGSTGTYCSVSIGTLHANCRKFMCARKARR